MLSQTGLYALQALLFLANQEEGAAVSAAGIARELDIPATYLAKVLQRLAQERILEGARGRRGGYRLVADPKRLTVAAAVAPFDGVGTPKVCLMGGPCHPDRPCAAHARRSAWTSAAREILEQTTLTDLLSGAPLEDLPSVAIQTSENPR